MLVHIRWKKLAAVGSILGICVFANNTNHGVPPHGSRPTWLAHVGVHQQYDLAGVGNDTCTASRIAPPTHLFIENTIESIGAAFDFGADVVEFDVQPTTDGHFVVFHDWRLECRTNGNGPTRAHSLAMLRQLDVGYGYTADGGRTFPLRGLGVGKMPTLEEVLERFPDRRFFVNIKSNDLAEGQAMARFLMTLPQARRDAIVIYGGDRPIRGVRELLPDQRVVSRATVKACLLRYAAFSWTGWIPEVCGRTAVLVPINYASYLWGWPNRFLNRMKAVDAEVFVLGPYGGGFSVGLDSAESLRQLPGGFSGGIWTNRIETLGPGKNR
jgi:glycerophosphoryl diester phosphodiesterase